MKRIFILCFLTAIFSIAAPADVKPPIPEKTPAKEALRGNLRIGVRRDLEEPTLVIKRRALEQLLAADSNAGLATAAQTDFFSRTQTIAGGLFLTLAFVFGGVLLFRRPAKSAKLAMSVIGLSAIGAGAAIVFANVPPNPRMSLTSRIFDQNFKNRSASGRIKIEIKDDGSGGEDFYLQIPLDERDKKSGEE